MIERSLDDELVVLASDGLWDVLSNQEVTDIALRCLDNADESGVQGVAAAKKAAASLAKAALDRGTRDNVTVLVIDLRQQQGNSQRSGMVV